MCPGKNHKNVCFLLKTKLKVISGLDDDGWTDKVEAMDTVVTVPQFKGNGTKDVAENRDACVTTRNKRVFEAMYAKAAGMMVRAKAAEAKMTMQIPTQRICTRIKRRGVLMKRRCCTQKIIKVSSWY